MGANTVIKDLGFIPESEWESITSNELPTVTSTDNGKVLTVVSGKWKKAEPSGGGAFAITATTEDDVTTLNKTWTEIKTAFDSGQNVIIADETSEELIVSIGVSDGEYYVGNYSTDSADGYPQGVSDS